MKIKLYRLFWIFLYPLLWEWSLFWSLRNFKTAKKIIKEHQIDLVYTSSAPYSVLLLGNKLKRKLGVKWVADLRDPFTDAYAWQFPTKLHWKCMRIFEKQYFNKPDKLVVNTNEVKKLYLKRGLTHPEKITVINNGY